MANLVTKSYSVDGSWTAPGGVKKVRLTIMASVPSQLSTSKSTIFGTNTRAIRSDGTVMGWGDVLPAGIFSSPILWGGLGWWARQMAFNMVLTVNGDLYGQGDNGFGQLGLNNSTVVISSPSLVVGGHKWRQVATDVGNSGGIDENGDARTWGANDAGQLGLGNTAARSSPALVPGGLKYSKIDVGFGVTALLSTTGDAYLAGFTPTGAVSSPTLIAGGYKFKDIAVANVWNDPRLNQTYFTGITTDGDAVSFGYNAFGQLGNGNTTNQTSLTPVLGGHKYQAIKAGGGWVTALTEDGDIRCWGIGTGGLLGDNAALSRSSPVLVVGGYKWIDIGTGAANTFGITKDGNMMAWGLNSNGSLGTGNVTSRSSPVLVVGGYKWGMPTRELVSFDEMIDVIPGTTYNIVMAGSVISFGNKYLQWPVGVTPTMKLSYEA